MRQLLTGSAGLLIAIMAVNAGNYGLNVLLANTLDPAVFGDASLMVTVLLITGVLAATIQLATSVAILKAPQRRDAQLGAVRLLTNRLGFLGSLLLVIASPFATSALQVESGWALLVMALGFPLHLQLAVERGRLQGDLQLGQLAFTFVAEGVARVVATLLAVMLAPDVTTLALALNVGFVGGYWVCRPRLARWSWLDLSNPAGHPPLGSVGVAVVAVTLVTNIDVIAAKGVLEPAAAGSFAALALGGRIVFFASWTLQQALLPLVIATQSPLSCRVRRRLFLAGNALVCAFLVTVGWVWAARWVDLGFGGKYSDVVALFGPYALGTGVISFVAALAVLRSTDGDHTTARVLLAGSLVLTFAVVLGGDSLDAIVHARLVAVFALGVVVVGARQLSERVPQRKLAACRSDMEGVFS